MLVQNYFIRQRNVMSPLRTGPIKMTSIHDKSYKARKSMRPLLSTIIYRHQCLKRERVKTRPPTTASHNRPSSPELKLITIIPTYTAYLQGKIAHNILSRELVLQQKGSLNYRI